MPREARTRIAAGVSEDFDSGERDGAVVNQKAEPDLVKIVVELDNAAVGGESLWAKPLGDNLFELRNTPWCAYNLHFGDVVRAIAPDESKKPLVQEVVRRSGHQTLRVVFEDSVRRERQDEIFAPIREWKASWERANSCYVAVDVLPEGNFDEVFSYFAELETNGELTFENGTQPEYPGFSDPTEYDDDSSA